MEQNFKRYRNAKASPLTSFCRFSRVSHTPFRRHFAAREIFYFRLQRYEIILKRQNLLSGKALPVYTNKSESAPSDTDPLTFFALQGLENGSCCFSVSGLSFRRKKKLNPQKIFGVDGVIGAVFGFENDAAGF